MPDALASMILALAIVHAPPGRSTYSFERAPGCGKDASKPTCVIERACVERGLHCRPPRWSAARGAWVRAETAQTATCRYAGIAEALAATARRLKECRDTAGEVIVGCAPVAWTGSTESLALSMLTVALHESGLREDVQDGIAPTGRGAGGGACLMQIRPSQAWRHARWLSEEKKASLERDVDGQEAFARSLLGESPEALRRCFAVGGTMLVRARKACGASAVPWDQGMFSMYGTGAFCTNRQVGLSRKRTFGRLVASSRSAPPPALGACER